MFAGHFLASALVSRGPHKTGVADPIFAKGMSYYTLIQGIRSESGGF